MQESADIELCERRPCVTKSASQLLDGASNRSTVAPERPMFQHTSTVGEDLHDRHRDAKQSDLADTQKLDGAADVAYRRTTVEGGRIGQPEESAGQRGVAVDDANDLGMAYQLVV